MGLLEVNKTKLPSLKGKPDGYLMEWDELDGFTLFVLFYKPTAEEIALMKAQMPFEIAFTELYDCGVISLKFAGLDWGDCSFEPRLYKKFIPIDCTKDKSQGIKLNIILVDTSNGIVKGLRIVGLGNDFSCKLMNWCEDKWNKKEGFTKERHFENMERVQRNYTSRELQKMASFRWKTR